MRMIMKKSAVNGRLLRFRIENGVLLPFTHFVLYVFVGSSSSLIGLFWFVSREKGVIFWSLLFLLLLPRTGMEEGGRRGEAESSSASGGVVVVQKSSDAVGEETEVELGGRDVEDEEFDADEDEEVGADGFVPSPLIPLKDQLEKDKILVVTVDQNKGMLGAFAPQRDPHELLLEEETTPSGVLARGIYSAKLKFEDDDKRCYLELDYSFEIKKR
ncbi:hypothetical protein B296_00033184 [Ensete ventricosum]|uniref:Uncharacterized protein n=1 Tax=Ensete ventricosum TaxID=4639 RepID=A0A426YX24_ENSVE|nr:hypothetical protein B296_00033184 [Ensete ventricosum]